ncbi:MAG: glutathione transferase [Inquilinus sp.]|nr:glutathione transferase [Inquilinus sp.]
MIRDLNHVTLAVSDLDRAVAFYRDVLGLELARQWPGGAYLSAGHMWLCLSPDPTVRQAPQPDYSHIAFDVAAEDFAAAVDRIHAAAAPIWKENRSEGLSLYFLDPDHHKLELHVGTLQSRLAAMTAEDN